MTETPKVLKRIYAELVQAAVHGEANRRIEKPFFAAVRGIYSSFSIFYVVDCVEVVITRIVAPQTMLLYLELEREFV